MNKETTLEAMQADKHEVKRDRDGLSQDYLGSRQQASLNRSVEQGLAHTEPAQTQAAELAIESPEIELGALLL